ncbi:MAG: hypothetical protein KDM64_20240, partial [Verrucomicrobiae bacterium]|nr:hypothetical protein [Verrucomicrobiae bacterium]
MALERIFAISRQGNRHQDRFLPFPVSGNAFPIHFCHFPWRERLKKQIFATSRHGKRHPNGILPLPATGRAFNADFQAFPCRESRGQGIHNASENPLFRLGKKFPQKSLTGPAGFKQDRENPNQGGTMIRDLTYYFGNPFRN